MEISQREKIQRSHNAGLVVTVVLELIALILLSVLVCFLRLTDLLPVREAPFSRSDDVISLTKTSGLATMSSFAYSADVPYAMVVTLSCALPVVVILVCELVRWKLADDNVLHIVSMCVICDVHTFLRRILRFTGTFLAGLLLTMVFVDVTKLMVGRLRPVFLEVCLVNTTVCYTDSLQCSVTAACMQADPSMLRWARLSFPSFHAATTSFAAVFMAIYLQTTVGVGLRSHVLGPFLSLLGVMAAILCGLARYSLNYSHWTDVVAGYVIGVVIAGYVCIFVLDEFQESREIVAHRLLNNMQHVSTPEVAVTQQKDKSAAPWYWTSWKWNLMEQIENGGNMELRPRDVNGLNNRKNGGDDVTSVSSSRDRRHIADTMYVYY